MTRVAIPKPNSTAKIICRKTLIAQPFYRKRPNIIQIIIDHFLFKTKHYYCKRNERWTSKKAETGVMKDDGWFWPDDLMMWKIYWPYGIENKKYMNYE